MSKPVCTKGDVDLLLELLPDMHRERLVEYREHCKKYGDKPDDRFRLVQTKGWWQNALTARFYAAHSRLPKISVVNSVIRLIQGNFHNLSDTFGVSDG